MSSNTLAVVALVAALVIGIAVALSGCTAQTIQPGIYVLQ